MFGQLSFWRIDTKREYWSREYLGERQVEIYLNQQDDGTSTVLLSHRPLVHLPTRYVLVISYLLLALSPNRLSNRNLLGRPTGRTDQGGASGGCCRGRGRATSARKILGRYPLNIVRAARTLLCQPIC